MGIELDAHGVDVLDTLVKRLTGAELGVLRVELARERELNRKLWVAVSELRLAVGVAWAAMDESPEHTEMTRASRAADGILGDIIGLEPETDEEDGDDD